MYNGVAAQRAFANTRAPHLVLPDGARRQAPFQRPAGLSLIELLVASTSVHIAGCVSEPASCRVASVGGEIDEIGVDLVDAHFLLRVLHLG